MNYFDRFKDVSLVKEMLAEIIIFDQKVKIMEVCGTHTRAIFRSGLRDILPENIALVSGPGCPICVTTQTYIDTAIELASREDVIIVTFADLLRVPGKSSSLQQIKATGGKIKIVHSPLEAVKIAKENIKYEVIFLAVGFETTAPVIALSILKAEQLNLKNYFLQLSIKTMPSVIEKILLDNELEIDAFICPGHVSSIIGSQPFSFIAEKYRLPAVIAGFERVDIIMALARAISLLEAGNIQVENLYNRAVKTHGNQKAKAVINQVFEITDNSWRGIGRIKESGLGLKERYRDFDVVNKFNMLNNHKYLINENYLRKDNCSKNDNYLREENFPENNEFALKCCCGDIIKGKKIPPNCKLFAASCTPLSPKGPCMVSEEGNCNIFYEYRGKR